MTVLQQQCLLGYLGHLGAGKMDGIQGAVTTFAVKEFQRTYGLVEDGICGPLTEQMLLDVVSGKVARKEPVAQTNTTAQAAVQVSSGTFWDSIRYFTREEFRCNCGGQYCNGFPDEMKEDVVRIADDARAHFGKPAHVVSGLRCSRWNAHEGGVANSQHMYGEAIDLRIDGVDSETLRQYVSSRPKHRYSYRINDTNVHFDINPVGR